MNCLSEKCKKCKRTLYYSRSMVNIENNTVTIFLYCPICGRRYSQLISNHTVYGIKEIKIKK